MAKSELYKKVHTIERIYDNYLRNQHIARSNGADAGRQPRSGANVWAFAGRRCVRQRPGCRRLHGTDVCRRARPHRHCSYAAEPCRDWRQSGRWRKFFVYSHALSIVVLFSNFHVILDRFVDIFLDFGWNIIIERFWNIINYLWIGIYRTAVRLCRLRSKMDTMTLVCWSMLIWTMDRTADQRVKFLFSCSGSSVIAWLQCFRCPVCSYMVLKNFGSYAY